jgi:predicted  nucleic acid-binding Zn-ribbon protein
MNIKREVYDRIVKALERELSVITSKINGNRYSFRNLEKEQTVLKREKAKLHEMLRDLRPKIKEAK